MDEPSLLDRRLAWDQVSPDEAGAVFSRAPESPARRGRPVSRWPLPAAPPTEETDLGEMAAVPFADLWLGVADGALIRLFNTLDEDVPAGLGLQPLRTGRYEDSFRQALVRDLVSRLAEVGEKVLWKEFTSRRTPSDVIFAHLGDPTRQGRPRRTLYCALLEEIHADGFGSLIERYPVFGEHLRVTVEQWTAHFSRFLSRLHADLGDLIATFQLPTDVEVRGLRPGLSDPHRGGQTAAVVELVSRAQGSTHLVVYKPKDLTIDRVFQGLLRELPKPRPDDATLGGVKVLVRPAYGYMEFVSHTPSADDAELSRFYRNAGRLTAVLYLLGCNDCHHENLIARGDQLHLVDAETLLGGWGSDDDSDLAARVANSVTALGILPQWQVVGQRRLARDVSALGIEPPAAERSTVQGWTYGNTDAMLVGTCERAAVVPTSSPAKPGDRNRIADFVEQLIDGFVDQLHAAEADRESWVGVGGHLSGFAGLRRRLVVRPTWIYAWLREQQADPAALTSWLRQRLVLETLAKSYLRSPERPRNWRLFHAEVAQMYELDVPFFEMPVDDVRLPLPDGSEIPDFLAASGCDTARRRVAGLDRQAIDFQAQLVRGAVLAKHHRSAGSTPHAVRVTRRSTQAFDPLGEAERIGDLLLDTAFDDGSDISEWLGTEVLQDLQTQRFGALGLSLYSGRVGIALFLATLSLQELPRSEDYRRLARRALADAPCRIWECPVETRRRWWRDRPLGIAGSAGVVLGLSLVSEILPEAVCPEAWDEMLRGCDEGVLCLDGRTDLVFGAAGLIGPLLRLGTPQAVSLAECAGQLLLEQQHSSGGWLPDGPGSTPLTGLSHGASGDAAALALLAAATGHRPYLDGARRALAYERTTFDKAHGNWPDFRSAEADGPNFAVSWCHGAPGIALARMCLRRTAASDERTTAELHTALTTTADARPVLSADSLCCGNLGRAAILRVAASELGTDAWLDAARSLERRTTTERQARGTYTSVNSLGLFQGLSGVGLAMLETADPSVAVLRQILSAGLYTGSNKP
ncbi:type 2 lanthipeptide synthetase LanM [Kitasatospora sp. NPDC094011]|uniref:type 2 lanthipeptide synthetase LanM n=1 Tax=Kitasatospora sp. NPDC094011 TaxID=3364090 RepID=UPI003822F7C0